MEILHATKQYEIWFMMIVVLILAFLIFAGIAEGIEKKNKLQTIICSILCATVLFGGVFLCYTQSQKERLKVIIHDYNQVDFNKYRIESNEGKIITLTEK